MIKRRLPLMLMGAAILLSGCSNTPAENTTETKTEEVIEENKDNTKDAAENTSGEAEKEEIPAQEESKEENTADPEPSEDALSGPETETEEADTEPTEDNSASETVIGIGGPEEGKYDRTYLYEENGVYVYRLSDPAFIQKYDELYEGAFDKIVESYEEVMRWQNQSFNANGKYTVSGLVLKDKSDTSVMNTGSYYEMDYNFNLDNVGYTYVDLKSNVYFTVG